MSVSGIVKITKESYSEWAKDNATRLAASLSFYTILSLTPLFVIVTSIAGLVYGREAAAGELTGQLRSLLGDAGADVVRTALASASEPKSGLLAAVIGVVSLLFGASGVFGELQSALNTIWDVKPKPGRGIWGTIRDRFLSFGMVIVFGFLLLVSLVVSTGLAAVGTYLENLKWGTALLMHLLNFIISTGVITVLFAMMYKFLPDVKIAWRDTWLGAVITAILFTLGKILIGFYLGRAGVASPFGAAGSLVVVVLWVYYSGLILFFGAELTQSTMTHYGRRIEPSDNAERADRADPSPRV